MTSIVCRHCGNEIGRLDAGDVLLAISIRGRRQRLYRVPAILSLTCEMCEQAGTPITQGEFLAGRELALEDARLGRIRAACIGQALAGVNV